MVSDYQTLCALNKRLTGSPPQLRNVAGAGEALLLADYYRHHKKPLVYVAPNSLEAYHLLEELAFLAPDIPVRHLPDWETLPYDNFSPVADITAKRIGALTALLDAAAGITITTVCALLLPYAPPAFIAARAFSLKTGGVLDIATMRQRLQQGGYARTDRVLTTGEYALYGGQMDIYPPEADHPLRLVLIGDEIEQIRIFDTETQRSIRHIEEFVTLPMSECDLSAEGRLRFANNYDACFDSDHTKLCKRVRNSEEVPGIEYYLPLFFEQAATVFDYMPPQQTLIVPEKMHDIAANYVHQVRLRQKVVSTYDNRPTLPVGALFVSVEECHRRLNDYQPLSLGAATEESAAPAVPINAPAARNAPYSLPQFIRDFDGRVIIAVDGEGRCDSLRELLAAESLPAVRCASFSDCCKQALSITVAALRGGFILPEARLALITENEIFQTRLPPRKRRVAPSSDGNLSAESIQAGDYVVHREYGIGKAHGLKNMKVSGEEGEYLEIEYAQTQRLFLPVSQLHLLEKYYGSAQLSKMGSRQWKQTAARAAAKAYDAAVRLLEINARRAVADIRGHQPDELLMARFIENFEHEETPDQQRAAEEVLREMRADKPMDRLIAADVGFGKTEIAARAAAAAVFSGRQAAIMAPTTLLAQQHYNTFGNRFAGFPLRIALLSRTATPSQRSAIYKNLAQGGLDIVIGTHALLNKKIRYKDLGVAVIDEEHRFGVSHKEKFKNMRAGVDVLSLSATPIPRTLAMALGGVRDISIINTPPASRLHIKTIEAPFSHAVVYEACERELMRGGQIFFIHNEIRTLDEIAQQLGKWLPQARVIVAHGAMNGRDLEQAMRRFVRRQGDILLCTTIVESGLDIANANTILINRADRMGLSRLHQLRGRVGRGSVQAYAYFLRPMDLEITKDAEARLAAARDYSEQGSGFFLSMRDLEIRGAGEILGERQSGDIEMVGVALYQRMINEATNQLRKTADVPADAAVTIQLNAPALLPDNYIPSPVERMRYYRRLHACSEEDALSEIFLEWEDRFGKLPEAAQLLKENHRLRLLMTRCLAESLSVDKRNQLTLTFNQRSPCSELLIQKITEGACQAASPQAVTKRLHSAKPIEQADEITHFLRGLLPVQSPSDLPAG